MSLPSVPPLIVAAIALIVAAVALFSLPTILGMGNPPAPAGVSSHGPSAGATSAASVEPTPPPQPTPTIYVVRSGDNLGKIARRFGTTIDAILKANPQIKDPNKIKVGDQITIPVKKSSSGPAASESSAP
jgi:LysM repeat protein